MVRLVARLAWRNLRSRPGQAALLLFALCLATTTVGLGLTIGETGNGAWDRLWRRTNGFDVSALQYTPEGVAPDDPAVLRQRAALATLATAPGVAAATGPVANLFTDGEVGGVPMELIAVVRDPAPAAVDQPLLTSGRWLGADDGVVLEDGLASTMGVRTGDAVTIAGHRYPVRGTAMTVTVVSFPRQQPGRVWVTPATGDRLRAAGAKERLTTVWLRLDRPGEAAAFVAAHPPGADAPRGEHFDAPFVELATAQATRDGIHEDLNTLAKVLMIIGTMLAGLMVATAAVLVAGRMAAQIRQVGTLKAVGVTPGQITCVLLVEYLALALVAAAVGLAAGVPLAPLLAGPSRVLYGAPQAPPVTWARAATVLAVAAAVVVLGTVRPALRGVRHSTLRSLAGAVRAPKRASAVARLAGRFGLPLPAALGLRFALRRPGRAVANAIGLALGVALMTAGLTLEKSAREVLAAQRATSANPAALAANEAFNNQLLTIVFVAATVLLALGAVNAVIVGAFAARDGARTYATLRAVGATPRQTVAAFVVAQFGACLLACAAGIPLGILLFDTYGEGLAPARLPALTYLLLASAVPLLYALTVAVPARWLARQPVTSALAYE